MPAQDRHRLYEFLPSSTPGALDCDGPQPLVPRIIDGMQHIADVVISKEAPTSGSTWQTRLHVGNEIRTADPEVIAENYLAHLGSTGMKEVRLFELDRPLPQSPSDASNIRLSVVAERGVPRHHYNYELTMYTPEASLAAGEQETFDEALYAQLLAEGRMDPREAERAVAAAQAKHLTAHSGVRQLEPLPEVPVSAIYSQFAFILAPAGKQKPRILARTFGADGIGAGSGSNSGKMPETPIDSTLQRLNAAYNANPQHLSTWQRMILSNRGGRALADFDLSLALRHLAGDKLHYGQRK